ncbi:MAG: zinc-dependent dehydrogenase [Candidatus Odinarchaeia archaeon]
MRVAVYYNNNDVRIEERPIPQISDDEILVKSHAIGICGSDVMEWYRIKTAPRVLGHEMVGEIYKVGKNVKKYSVGQRVFVSHHVPCNSCRYCYYDYHTACETLHTTNYDPGGFSEFIRVPKINVDRGVFILPDTLSYDEGVFIEPLACAIRGQEHLDIKKGQTVLVMGCGVSGILHIQLSKLYGAGKIIATNNREYRRKLAEKFGADITLTPKEATVEKIRELNDGNLIDKIIVSTGASKAVEQAFELIDRGGTILFYAVPPPTVNIPVNFNKLWRNEVSIKMSYGAAPKELFKSIQLLKNKRINVKDMITHKLPLTEAQKGFQLVASGDQALKVVLYSTSGQQ